MEQTWHRLSRNRMTPLGMLTLPELKQIVRFESSKQGAFSDRDIANIFYRYLEKSDFGLDSPVNVLEIEAVVQIYSALKSPDRLELLRARCQAIKVDSEIGTPNVKRGIRQGPSVPPKNPRKPTFFEQTRFRLSRYGRKAFRLDTRNLLVDSVHKKSRTPSALELITQGESVAAAAPGKMFLYRYEARNAEELTCWDRSPLVLVLELYDDGWLGINLHYLPLIPRVRLFDKLLQFVNERTLDQITKLPVPYSILDDRVKYPEIFPCIERYWCSSLTSRLLLIPAIDWEIALFLPVEEFQKMTVECVWKETLKAIKQLKRG